MKQLLLLVSPAVATYPVAACPTARVRRAGSVSLLVSTAFLSTLWGFFVLGVPCQGAEEPTAFIQSSLKSSPPDTTLTAVPTAASINPSLSGLSAKDTQSPGEATPAVRAGREGQAWILGATGPQDQADHNQASNDQAGATHGLVRAEGIQTGDPSKGSRQEGSSQAIKRRAPEKGTPNRTTLGSAGAERAGVEGVGENAGATALSRRGIENPFGTPLSSPDHLSHSRQNAAIQAEIQGGIKLAASGAGRKGGTPWNPALAELPEPRRAEPESGPFGRVKPNLTGMATVTAAVTAASLSATPHEDGAGYCSYVTLAWGAPDPANFGHLEVWRTGPGTPTLLQSTNSSAAGSTQDYYLSLTRAAQTFSYELRVYDYSNVLLSTGSATTSLKDDKPTAAAPDAQYNMKGIGCAQVTLTWPYLPVCDVIRYHVERSDEGGAFQEIGTVDATYNPGEDFTYQDYSVTPKPAPLPADEGHHYVYRLIAEDHNGVGDPSADVPVSLKDETPNAVTDFDTSVVNHGLNCTQVTLTWQWNDGDDCDFKQFNIMRRQTVPALTPPLDDWQNIATYAGGYGTSSTPGWSYTDSYGASPLPDPGRTYEYRVDTVDRGDQVVEGPSLPVPLTDEVPPAVTDFVAEAQGNGQNCTSVLLTWEPISGDETCDFDHYFIERKVGTGNWEPLATLNDLSAASYTDYYGVMPAPGPDGADYQYRLTVYDRNNQPSAGATSSAKLIDDKPDDVTDVEANATNHGKNCTSVLVTWTPLDWTKRCDLTAYQIWRSSDGTTFTQIGQANPWESSYSDYYGVDPMPGPDGITYTYKVVSVDQAQQSSAGAIGDTGALIDEVPVAPQPDVSVTQGGYSCVTVDVSWPALSDQCDLQQVTLKRVNVNTGAIDVLLSGNTLYSTSYHDYYGLQPSPTPGTTYEYTLTLTDNNNQSDSKSITTEALVDEEPDAPANLQLVHLEQGGQGCAWAEIAWDPNTECDFDTFHVYRLNNNTQMETWLGDTSSPSYYDYGVQSTHAGVSYTYRVVTEDRGGNTKESTITTAPLVDDLPEAPGNLGFTHVEQGGQGCVWTELAWDANTECDFSAFHLFRRNNTTGITTFLGDSWSSTYYDYGVESAIGGVDYTYRVVAEDRNGNWSESTITTPSLNDTVPLAPAWAATTDTTAHSFHLHWTWTEECDFDHFEIFRSETAGVPLDAAHRVATLNSSGVRDTVDYGLDALQHYHYVIVVYDRRGQWAASGELGGPDGVRTLALPDLWYAYESPTPYFQGDNTYENTDNGNYHNQKIEKWVKPLQPAVYFLTVQNDGKEDDSFLVNGGAGDGVPTGWTVTYYDALTGGTDITTAVTNGGWTTPTLANNATQEIRVEVIAGETVPLDSAYEVNVEASSTTNPSEKDIVKTITTMGILPFDLDADVDNTSPFGEYSSAEGDRSDEEEDAEDNGCAVNAFINDLDLDKNGVPGYADAQSPNASGKFEPLLLDISSPQNGPNAKYIFRYSASDPNQVTQIGTGDDTKYILPVYGYLRIWTKDGPDVRNPQPIGLGGDFIVPEVEYTAADLGWTPGTKTLRLYIEAVRFRNDTSESEDVIIELWERGVSASNYPRIDSVRVEPFSARDANFSLGGGANNGQQGGGDAEEF